MRFVAVLSSALVLVLTGCAFGPTAAPNAVTGLGIQGRLRGGNQPIAGAQVYLLAANTAGYGTVSVSLLTSGTNGSDSIGGYVLSDSGGNFTITGDYTCTSGQQVYLYAQGGDPGAGTNTAVGLMAVLGSCPDSGNFLAVSPFINVNEVTTVAAAYALAGFATDATHVSSSGTPLAQTGIANAFANAGNLADISSGTALTTTPAGNGTVPQTEINTLANILAACVNSTGSSSTGCSTLFSNAKSGGSTGTTPTETATAAINMVHNPTANVAALFPLQTAAAPFAPMLSYAPSDFTMVLTFNVPAGGVQNFAIDGFGNVWTLNYGTSGTSRLITKLSSSGAVLSGSTGYPIPNDAGSLAIDQVGTAWLTGNGNVYRVSGSGTVSTFHPDESVSYTNIAMDASGNIWLDGSSGTSGALVELSSSGTDLHFNATGPIGGTGLALSNSGVLWTTGGNQWLYGTSIATGNNLNVAGSGLNSPNGAALDSAGNIWVSESCCVGTSISEFSYNTSTSSYSRVSSAGFDYRPLGMTIDGANNVWILIRYPGASISSFSNSGSGIQLNASYGLNGYLSLNGLALDASGNVWTSWGSNLDRKSVV